MLKKRYAASDDNPWNKAGGATADNKQMATDALPPPKVDDIANNSTVAESSPTLLAEKNELRQSLPTTAPTLPVAVTSQPAGRLTIEQKKREISAVEFNSWDKTAKAREEQADEYVNSRMQTLQQSIDSLTRQKSELNNLEEIIKTKAAEIDKRHKHRETALQKEQEALRLHGKKLEELGTNYQAKESLLNDKQAMLNQKTAELEQRSKELLAQETINRELQKQQERKNNQLTQLEEVLEQKESDLNADQERLQQYEQDLKKLQATVAGNEARFDSRQAAEGAALLQKTRSLQQEAEELVNNKVLLERLQQELQAQEKSLKQQTQELIDNTNSAFANREAALLTKEATLKKSQEQFNRDQEQLKTDKETLQAQTAALQDQTTTLQQEEEQLKQQETAYRAAKKDLENRQSLLQAEQERQTLKKAELENRESQLQKLETKTKELESAQQTSYELLKTKTAAIERRELAVQEREEQPAEIVKLQQIKKELAKRVSWATILIAVFLMAWLVTTFGPGRTWLPTPVAVTDTATTPAKLDNKLQPPEQLSDSATTITATTPETKESPAVTPPLTELPDPTLSAETTTDSQPQQPMETAASKAMLATEPTVAQQQSMAAPTPEPSPPLEPTIVEETAHEPTIVEETTHEPNTVEEAVAKPDPEQEKLAAAARLAQEKVTAKINKLLAAIDKDIEASRLSRPASNNALQKLREIQSLQPDSPEAKKGFERVAEKYVSLAATAVENRRWNRAKALLTKAEQIQPQLATMEAVRIKLPDAQQKQLSKPAIPTTTVPADTKTATENHEPPVPATQPAKPEEILKKPEDSAKQQVNIKLPTWHWPLYKKLDRVTKEDIEQLRDQLMPFRDDLPAKMSREAFLNAIANSISLKKEEKLKVLKAYPTLKYQQIFNLFVIFQQEIQKFPNLWQQHGDEVKKIMRQRQQEWSEIVISAAKQPKTN